VKTGTLTDYVENDSANYVPLPDTEFIPRIQSFSVQRHTIYSDHCFSKTTYTKSFCKDEESVAIMFSALIFSDLSVLLLHPVSHESHMILATMRCEVGDYAVQYEKGFIGTIPI